MDCLDGGCPDCPLPAALPFTSTLRCSPSLLSSALSPLRASSLFLSLLSLVCLSVSPSLSLNLILRQNPGPRRSGPLRSSLVSACSVCPLSLSDSFPRGPLHALPTASQPANCTSSTKRAQLTVGSSRRGGAERAPARVCMHVCLSVRRRGGKIIIR